MKFYNKEPEKILELKLSPSINSSPFSITFSSKHEHITISLQDSRDVLKLADAYKELLDKLKIPYLETYKNDNNEISN
jgi:hypothetical protein